MSPLSAFSNNIATTTTTMQRVNKEKMQQPTSIQQPAITTTTTSKQKKRILSDYHLSVAEDIRERGLRDVTVDVVSKTLRNLLLIQAYDKSILDGARNGVGRAIAVAEAMGSAVETITSSTTANPAGLYHERGNLIAEVLSFCHRPASALEMTNPRGALFATKPKQASAENSLQHGMQGLRLAQQMLRIVHKEIEPLWKNQCTNNGELKPGRSARNTVLELLELRLAQIQEKRAQNKNTVNENSGDNSSDEGDAPETVNDAKCEGATDAQRQVKSKETAKKLYKLITDPVFVFIVFGPPCKLLRNELQPLAVLVNVGEELDDGKTHTNVELVSAMHESDKLKGKIEDPQLAVLVHNDEDLDEMSVSDQIQDTTEAELVSVMRKSNEINERIEAQIEARQAMQDVFQAAKDARESTTRRIEHIERKINKLKEQQAELRSAKKNTNDPEELEDILCGKTYEEKRDELRAQIRKYQKELDELKALRLEGIASQLRFAAAAAAAAAASASTSLPPSSDLSDSLSSHSVPEYVGDDVEEEITSEEDVADVATERCTKKPKFDGE